jgi:predicted enzyme related to lactoylglutathione lyase
MSESNGSKTNCGPGHIGWNELVTTDVPGATTFYEQLFGWKAEAFGKHGGYQILKKDDASIGGIMQSSQPGLRSQWIAYTVVEDVDRVAAKTVTLGGKVLMTPFDVTGVGRVAILADAQGASFGIFKPEQKAE